MLSKRDVLEIRAGFLKRDARPCVMGNNEERIDSFLLALYVHIPELRINLRRILSNDEKVSLARRYRQPDHGWQTTFTKTGPLERPATIAIFR